LVFRAATLPLHSPTVQIVAVSKISSVDDGETHVEIQVLRQSRHRLRRQDGRGPRYIKVEGAVLYRLSDVLEYLNTRPSGGRVIGKPLDTATESK
jgi:hypothetical protein